MGWRSVFVLLAMVAGQAPAPELPPPFPRPGTTKLFENDVVAVWNVSWLKQQYPLHTHRYDLVGVSYVEGDRIITQGNNPGRLVNTKAWVFRYMINKRARKMAWATSSSSASRRPERSAARHTPW